MQLGSRLAAAALVLVAVSCSPSAKRYPVHGQVLAVDTKQQQLTIKHDDIPGLMPAMTMTYPVASAKLLEGRAPGEMIDAQLEVADAIGRLVTVTHLGTAPLPANSNEVALASSLLSVGDVAPDVAVIDQTDKRRSLAEWAGTPTLITFIYTRCPLPNFCPLMDLNFQTLQKKLALDPGLKGRLKLISVSIDPDYDTPAVLAAHAKRVGADPAVWTFLTGDRATIDHLAAQFGVGVLRDPAQPSIVTHNLRTTLIGADRRIAKIYSGNDWRPGDVVADVEKMK